MNQNDKGRNIMLRFRPIAPKPPTPVPAGLGTVPANKMKSNNNDCVTRGRAKRKYTRAKNNNNNKKDHEKTNTTTLDLLPKPDPTASESTVTVETVTDVYTSASTETTMEDLGADTCPGFVTDSEDNHKVIWVNQSYRNMAREVRLVVKQLPKDEVAFTCRVRVEYTWQEEKKSQVVVLPCDVWRLMDFGGRILAWRLDLDAALTLGLPHPRYI